MKLTSLFTAVACAPLIMTFCGATPAVAQSTGPVKSAGGSTAASANGNTVAEVVVTTRRQAERLQDVPLAVTALTSTVLEQSGVQNLADAAALTPGLLIAKSSAETGTSPLGGGGVIRGLVDVSGAGNNTVGVFFNGVALTNAYAVSVGIIDMERIEIVKGPVSALYGRGAFAGAINYVTKQPSDHLEGHITGEVGNGGKRAVSGEISGPIIKDVLSLGFAGSYDKFDGTYQDQVNGLKAGGHDKKDFRLSFLLTPTADMKIFGGYYRGDDGFNVAPQVHADNNCGAFNAARPVGSQFNYLCGLVTVPHPVEVGPISGNAGQTANKRNVQIADLHLTDDFGWMNAAVTFGYNKVTEIAFQDFTSYRNGIPFTLSPGPGTINLLELFGSNNNNEDFSTEIRFASRQDQRFRWAIGGYAFDGRSTTSTLVGLDASRLPPGQTIGGFAGQFLTPNGQLSTSNITLTNFTDRQLSPFGSIDIDVIGGLTAFGELRYTSQTKSFDIIRNNSVPNTVRPFGPGRSADFKYTNYRAGLRYKFTPDISAYVTIATGEKAGGFNQRATLPVDFVYAPETNTTYEAGLKSQFLDRRLLLNAAIYYVQDQGLQVSGPSSDPKNPGLVTTNYGNTTSKGFELEGAAVMNSFITFNASAAYTDPKFSSNAYDFSAPSQDYISALASCNAIPLCASRQNLAFQTPSGPRRAVSLAGLQTPFTSKWIVNLGMNLKGNITDNMKWFGRAEYRYESKRFNTVEDIFWVGAHNNVDLSAGLTRGPISGIVYVNNLLNDQTPLYTFANARLSDFGSTWVSNLPDARQYGVRLTFTY